MMAHEVCQELMTVVNLLLLIICGCFPQDAATAKHKGFCFIEFHSSEAAENALNTMNEFVLAGRWVPDSSCCRGCISNLPLKLQFIVHRDIR